MHVFFFDFADHDLNGQRVISAVKPNGFVQVDALFGKLSVVHDQVQVKALMFGVRLAQGQENGPERSNPAFFIRWNSK
jgi:hypothetical protein